MRKSDVHVMLIQMFTRLIFDISDRKVGHKDQNESKHIFTVTESLAATTMMMVMSMESTSNTAASTSSKERGSECEQNQIWLTASKHSFDEKDIKNYTYHFLWIKHKSREL